jgi:hypothetical protein
LRTQDRRTPTPTSIERCTARSTRGELDSYQRKGSDVSPRPISYPTSHLTLPPHPCYTPTRVRRRHPPSSVIRVTNIDVLLRRKLAT